MSLSLSCLVIFIKGNTTKRHGRAVLREKYGTKRNHSQSRVGGRGSQHPTASAAGQGSEGSHEASRRTICLREG